MDYIIIVVVILLALVLVLIRQQADNAKLQHAVEAKYDKLAKDIAIVSAEILEVKGIIASRKNPRPRAERVIQDGCGGANKDDPYKIF